MKLLSGNVPLTTARRLGPAGPRCSMQWRSESRQAGFLLSHRACTITTRAFFAADRRTGQHPQLRPGSAAWEARFDPHIVLERCGNRGDSPVMWMLLPLKTLLLL